MIRHSFLLLFVFMMIVTPIYTQESGSVEQRINDLKTKLPERIRPFLVIDANKDAIEDSMFVKSFIEAVEKIEPNIFLNRSINILINTSPFVYNLGHGIVEFTLNPETINLYVAHNIVLLDYIKMSKYKYPIKVATVLEELVHAFMNISDEVFIKKVVVLLYDKVELIDGKYHVKE